MQRNYSDAIAALNSLQSNYQIVSAIRRNGLSLNKHAIPEMIDWVHRIGYEPSDFNRLRLIHIAGTKGKGSTSAFISSILTQYRPSASQSKPLLHNIGLYTSPHLRFVRERIQINGEPLSEDAFARYFFETWDRLERTAQERGEPTGITAKPVYFRYLTLMAFHTYMSEGVDTAIIECGIGGEYDSTNILVSPIVTGITSLGIDHTDMLGNTIEEIAWQKGGVMKVSAPCFTVPQPSTALAVLQKRSTEIPTRLEVIDRNPELDNIKLGLAADFQYINASLAVAIASAHLSAIGHTISPSPLPAEFTRGLEEVRWPGRCEIRHENHISWHIDAGHTLESIHLAGTWFASQIPTSASKSKKPTRILLFNQQTRDANALARALHATIAKALHSESPFTHAVFCTNTTFRETGFGPDLRSMNTDSEAVAGLQVQKGLASAWKEIDAATVVAVKSTVEDAVTWCRGVAGDAGEETMVLVTGSVHLVGGFLEVLGTDTEHRNGAV